jgi:protein disulfide-isomerase
MKKILSCIGMFVILTGSAWAAGNAWMTDMDKAMKMSAKTGKPILADFSGSDWCGWCIKLDREVFSQKVFLDYAKKNLILVMLDFPRRKTQSEKLIAQNKKLRDKYKVRGYPTVLLLDSKGKVIATTGYRRGGAKKYVEYLEKLLEKVNKK